MRNSAHDECGRRHRELPEGVPPDVAERIQDLAAQVSGHGFVTTPAPTMGLPLG